eukprot:351900-Chlamydomonas_euryale.AAC.5
MAPQVGDRGSLPNFDAKAAGAPFNVAAHLTGLFEEFVVKPNVVCVHRASTTGFVLGGLNAFARHPSRARCGSFTAQREAARPTVAMQRDAGEKTRFDARFQDQKEFKTNSAVCVGQTCSHMVWEFRPPPHCAVQTVHNRRQRRNFLSQTILCPRRSHCRAALHAFRPVRSHAVAHLSNPDAGWSTQRVAADPLRPGYPTLPPTRWPPPASASTCMSYAASWPRRRRRSRRGPNSAPRLRRRSATRTFKLCRTSRVRIQ